MEAKSAVKVGIVVLIGMAVFGGLYYYLAHLNPNTYIIRVAFTDTKGLVPQSVVRMRGVAVGEVRQVELVHLQPIVTLAIQNDQKIPKDSKFLVVSGILITNPQVEIIPGTANQYVAANSTVQGAPPQGALHQLSPELEQTVTKVNKSFDELTTKFNKAYGKIDTILSKTTTLVTNVNKTVQSTNNLIGNPKLRDQLLTTVSNFKQVSVEGRATVHDLRVNLVDILHSSKGTLQNVGTKLTDILARVDTTLDEADTVIKRLTEQVTDPRFQQSVQDTLELARTTLARFNQIADDIHQLTGDPKLQGDLKASVENLRTVTAQGAQATEKLNTLLGKLTGNEAAKRFHLPPIQLVGNVSEEMNPGRLRLDLESRITTSRNSLVDLGLYDIGQDTRLILQGGARPTPSTLFRYGLYASKIGVGLDWEPSHGSGFRADLYDTVHPRLDVRGLFRVNSDASLWVGADGIFRQTVPVIGVQFSK